MKYLISIIILILTGCSNSPTNSQNDKVEEEKPSMAEIILPKDNLFNFDSVLYNENLLQEISKGRMTYDLEFDESKSILSIKSSSIIEEIELVYQIEYEFEKNKFESDGFNFFKEGIDGYLNSSIGVNGWKTDLTNVHFANDKTEKISPAGPWHGSIEESALKYYQIKDSEIFLLNGVNLFCNGRYCTSYQVFIVVKMENSLSSYALYFDGKFYSFDDIRLVDIEKDGIAEIFVPKDESGEINSIADFDIYSITERGLILTNN